VLSATVLCILCLAAIGGCAAPAPAPAPDLDGYPWVYLRDGRALTADESLVSLIAVGDALLGRGVAETPAPLADVSAWLGSADLTLGNLEGVLVADGAPRSAPAGEPQPIILAMPPEAAADLRRAGFDLLSVANNHALDYGPEGLALTVARLERAGLAAVGLADGEGAVAPLLREVNGVRLAFLAFNAVPDPHPDQVCPPERPCAIQPARWDTETAAAAVAAARAQADAVIVAMHWGVEYQPRPAPAQERIAAALRAAGADLIVGHHPHTAQPIALLEQTVVAYSLGNFVFDQETPETREGLALRAFFDRDGLRAVQALPLRAGPQPRLLVPEAGAALLARVLPPPPRLGIACDPAGCAPAEVPQTPQNDRFFAGQIDLTGDGALETVRREGEQVVVYAGETAVWRSPPEWRVVDAALGDPNDDGRYEIMLAIWRVDAAGHPRSQPYLVGYRGGAYTLLWGGRPVVNPILELALGDVDSDGIEELVVIEELADGSGQAVSVWQWQGWTFSLQWRSENGRYRDLALIPDAQGNLIISVAQPGNEIQNSALP
jgi:hypothetical protein